MRTFSLSPILRFFRLAKAKLECAAPEKRDKNYACSLGKLSGFLEN